MWLCQSCGHTVPDDHDQFCGQCGKGRDGAEATACAVVLRGCAPQQKIETIKVVRTLTPLGLKEAKDLVESPPRTVVTGITRAEAEQATAALHAAGAEVEIVPAGAALSPAPPPATPTAARGCATLLLALVGALVGVGIACAALVR